MIKDECLSAILEIKTNLAAPNNIERIVDILPFIKEDALICAEAQHLLGKIFLINHDLVNALKHFELSLEQSDNASEIEIKSKTYGNMGVLFQQNGDFNKAKYYHEQSLELKYKLEDDISIANSLINLGTVATLQDELIEALKYFDAALKIYEKENRYVEFAKCLYNIGSVYIKNDNFDSSIEYFIDALGHITIDQEARLFIMININLGSAYLSLSNFSSAEKYLKRSLENSKKHQFFLGEVTALAMLGEMYLKENKVQLAKQYCLDALSIKDASFYDAHSSAYLDLGIIEFQKNQATESLEYLILAFEIANKHDLIRRKREVLKWLVQAYEKNDDFVSAYKFQSELMLLKDSHHAKKIDSKLDELKYISEKERVERESAWHEQKNQELEIEKRRADDLLKNILPDKVAEELKNSGTYKAVLHEDVTVMFTDFHEFSHISRLMSPQELVEELHQCFKMFDTIISKYGIEKIKTVGDAYLAASGLHANGSSHTKDMILAAIEIRDFIKSRKQELGDRTFNIRIGIHCGPVVAGIVGVKKFAYDIWGDTVNIAARIEQNVAVGNISISESCYNYIKDSIPCETQGEISAKNIGVLKVYQVI